MDAVLLNEAGRQTAVVVEITKANLTSLQAVIGELQESREAGDQANRAMFQLSVAIFVAAAIAAIAVAPQVVHEIASLWNWVTPLL